MSMNTDTTPSKDGTRLGSRQVDAVVRELMLKHVIRSSSPEPHTSGFVTNAETSSSERS